MDLEKFKDNHTNNKKETFHLQTTKQLKGNGETQCLTEGKKLRKKKGRRDKRIRGKRRGGEEAEAAA